MKPVVLGLLAFATFVALMTVSPFWRGFVNGLTGLDSALAAAAPASPVGGIARNDKWEMKLYAFAPYGDFEKRTVSPPPQGNLMVVAFTATNRTKEKAGIRDDDFTIQSSDGRIFKHVNRPIDKALRVGSQTVQPGLGTDNRVVFDIDPSASGLVLHALGMKFDLK